jgi:cytochrome c oxidase subunit II
VTRRLSRATAVALPAPLLLVVAGCGSTQNSLAPHSHQARDIANLFWWMMGGAWIGLALVVGLLLLSWKRAGRRGFGRDSEGPKPGERPGWYVVVGAGIVLPIVVISTLFVISDTLVIRTTEAPAKAATSLTVQVIGHQFWWEIRYPGSRAVTANELHIPVDTPVRVEVRTADVIHSLWVPELNRKIDTIPGRTNVIELDANSTGFYRGECAEFCGLQHAKMGIAVFVDSPSAFRTWLARQAKPAAPPRSAAARRGLRLFTSGACATCHAIRGTSAASNVGPDLTHVAGRTTLGALAIENGGGRLREWIANSQGIKPGNQMPNVQLGRTQLDDLAAYLSGLK